MCIGETSYLALQAAIAALAVVVAACSLAIAWLVCRVNHYEKERRFIDSLVD